MARMLRQVRQKSANVVGAKPAPTKRLPREITTTKLSASTTARCVKELASSITASDETRCSLLHWRQTDTQSLDVPSMVTGIGSSTVAPLGTAGTQKAESAASLSGQIRQDKIQLDDWTTCVSSKTTRGQAEIQRLSGAISAAKQQEQRILGSSGSIDVWV